MVVIDGRTSMGMRVKLVKIYDGTSRHVSFMRADCECFLHAVLMSALSITYQECRFLLKASSSLHGFLHDLFPRGMW